MAIDMSATPPTCNQSDLAKMVGCDRTTIRHYTQAGMACTPKTKGRENNYVVPLCINWIAGWMAAREHGLPQMSSLELILFGYLTAYWNDPSSREYHARAAGLAEKAGATPAEFEQAVGFLRGAKLLPRSW
jgi:hypothetical protein